MAKAKTIAELRKMSGEQLIKEHDEHTKDVYVGVDYYLDEIRRRESAKNEKIMLWLTIAVAAMTLVNLVVFINTV